MGTNYYWCINYCTHCQRSEKHHIGKRSGGWQFAFQAYPDGVHDDDWKPITPPIMSWSDWKKVVVRQPEDQKDPLYKVPWGHIEDEYGSVIPPDEFEEIVEKSAGEKNHVDYLLSSYHKSSYNSKLDFKDSEGWTMSTVDFS